MKEKKIWKYISDKILSDQKVVLLIVANSSNSSPGRTGFKMAISDDGTSIGTIGGGIMEFDIISEIKESFAKNRYFNSVRKLHHSNLARGEKSGLICGGVQTIIFKSLSKTNIDVINNIVEASNEMVNGVLTISESSFLFTPEKINHQDISMKIESDSNWKFEENIGTQNTVYIVGGGHVGLAVSRIMSTLDFHVVVFDHRKEVHTMNENCYANQKIITSYDKINDYIVEGDKAYVVIVTPSHDGDKTAVQIAIKLNLKYIGMMGSKKKVDSIFSQLRNSGIAESLIKKINTPIGIEIEAESPEEIAISIAAEIIKRKNN